MRGTIPAKRLVHTPEALLDVIPNILVDLDADSNAFTEVAGGVTSIQTGGSRALQLLQVGAGRCKHGPVLNGRNAFYTEDTTQRHIGVDSISSAIGDSTLLFVGKLDTLGDADRLLTTRSTTAYGARVEVDCNGTDPSIDPNSAPTTPLAGIGNSAFVTGLSFRNSDNIFHVVANGKLISEFTDGWGGINVRGFYMFANPDGGDPAHGMFARCIIANTYTPRYKLRQYCDILRDYYNIPRLP